MLKKLFFDYLLFSQILAVTYINTKVVIYPQENIIQHMNNEYRIEK
jgi:hypothetical protein